MLLLVPYLQVNIWGAIWVDEIRFTDPGVPGQVNMGVPYRPGQFNMEQFYLLG